MKQRKILKRIKADGWNVGLNDKFGGDKKVSLSFNDIAELMHKYSEEQLVHSGESIEVSTFKYKVKNDFPWTMHNVGEIIETNSSHMAYIVQGGENEESEKFDL